MDHPATADLKAKGIAAMGPRENLILISEDLGRRKIAHVLKDNALWNPSRQTVILAEGLVMYLPPEAVRDLFRQCADIAHAGSRLVFTYIPADEDGRPDAGRWTGLMLWLQEAAGEPWTWSIRREALGRFMEETGWEIDSENRDMAVRHGVEFYAVAKKGVCRGKG
jgi:methyltransferase (TIGR00027 family)